MNISSFTLSNDSQNLNITIENALNVTSLFLFTENTYKNYDLAINLSDLLQGVATETISVSLEYLNIPYFDGIYFLEAEDDVDVSNSFLSVLTRYEECIIDKILQINQCDDCLKQKSLPLINAQTTLEGVKMALTQGFVQEAINFINNLKKYCSDKCKSCGEYNNVINNNYLSYNDQ